MEAKGFLWSQYDLNKIITTLLESQCVLNLQYFHSMEMMFMESAMFLYGICNIFIELVRL